MHKSTWKRAEDRVARLFGARRNSLSGGNSKLSRSDSTSSSVYLEVKWSARQSAIRTLLDASRKLAKNENKVAVVAVGKYSRPGVMLCFHSYDLADVVLAVVRHNPEIRERVVEQLNS